MDTDRVKMVIRLNRYRRLLFDRLYRVHTQGNIPGTGLGLSIAQELVELRGGRIAAAPSPGKGSVFAIYLPLLEE